jgi:GNAT superfamily N-acetyltransferase
MKNSLSKLWGAALDLGYYLRHKNPLQAGRWLARAVRLAFYNRIEYIVLTRSLEEPLPNLTFDLPLRFEAADPNSFESLRGVIPPSEYRRLKKRLMRGRICRLVFWNGYLVHYGWLSDKIDFETDNLELRLNPGDTYLDDAFTVPAYRRRGIHTLAHLDRLRWAQKNGFRRSVVIVNAKNAVPRRVMRKLNYQETDRLFLRRFLAKRVWHSETGKS